VAVGVQLGPLGTAATNRPIRPAPDNYDDGEIGRMMIGRENRSNRRKPASVPLCPPQTPHACPEANPVRRYGKLATNRYGTTLRNYIGTSPLVYHFTKREIKLTRKLLKHITVNHLHSKLYPISFS
jgi:hypothetical protein